MGFVKSASFVLQRHYGSTLIAAPPAPHLQSLLPFAAKALIIRGGASSVVDGAVPHITAFRISLLVSTFLCTTCFGMILFAALALMPGIGSLPAGEYLRAFQQVDKMFQEKQPFLKLIWLGAVVSLVTTTVLGVRGGALEEKKDKLLFVLSTLCYLAGQVSTFAVNLPLNNHIQELDISSLDDKTKQAERNSFEGPWVKANWFRVVTFGMSSALLMVQLLLV